MSNLLQWFTGGETYNYHNLFQCMDNDLVTLTLVVSLCVGVFSGYLIIAYRWFKAAKEAPESEAKQALQDLKWIFILCATCGYLFVILKTVWPAWRFYMFFLALLNYFTWRYVLRIEALDTIYSYLKDRDDLIKENQAKQEEIERLERSKMNI